jgi:hypothetical protein
MLLKLCPEISSDGLLDSILSAVQSTTSAMSIPYFANRLTSLLYADLPLFGSCCVVIMVLMRSVCTSDRLHSGQSFQLRLVVRE